MMQAICKHLANHGGSALIGDYGHWGEKEDTFRVCIYTHSANSLIHRNNSSSFLHKGIS